MIVSVSRRCDIPRFAFDWFLERLDAGFAEIKNPFNPHQIRRVSLLSPSSERTPEELKTEGRAEVFAFWTRDPASILKHAERLEEQGYGFFVMTTLNSYPALLEPNVPPPEEVAQTMRGLAQKTSRERVIWRYDPVLLSSQTDFEFHRRNFSALAARFNGAVSRVIVSVYDEYPRAEKRLAALEQNGSLKRQAHYQSGPEGKKRLLPAVRDLLAELARIARREGMEIQSCAEEDLADCFQPGACIDGEYISKLFGIKVPGKDRNQRPGCLCAQSVDIGTYGSCPAGCVYCYADRS